MKITKHLFLELAILKRVCYNFYANEYRQEALSAARNRERPDTRRNNARVAYTAQKLCECSSRVSVPFCF